MGNEYRTMADCETGIMMFAELVEGKQRPASFVPDHDHLGATTGLLIRAIDHCGLSGSHRHLFVDTGYSSAEAISRLLENDIYVTGAMKKRRGWPRHVPGKDIEEAVQSWPLFASKHATVEPGSTGSNKIGVFVMRDPSYPVVFLSTSATTKDSAKTQHRNLKIDAQGNQVQAAQWHVVKVPDFLAVYHASRHAVDDHNNLRHNFGNLEEIMGRFQWHKRQFAFFLNLVATNAFLAWRARSGSQRHLHAVDFRRTLAEQLLHLGDVRHPAAVKRHAGDALLHEILSFKASELGVHGSHPQRKCKYCSRHVTTYCSCDPHKAVCKHCFSSHSVE
jgi:hypothetical protein